MVHSVRSCVRFLSFALTLLVLATSPADARAEASTGKSSSPSGTPLSLKDVPEPLKPWTGWALRGNEEATCSNVLGDASPHCAWPSTLSLSLDDHGGTFSQTWVTEIPSDVALPGDSKRWPLRVKAGTARAPVIGTDTPTLHLPAGRTTITGTFEWDSLPESLKIPKETGLLSLRLKGADVVNPNRDADGTVWLQKVSAGEDGDALDISVHRKVDDGVPTLLTTRITLKISGKNRELALGRALPDGFVPLSIVSPLPARVEADSRLRVQLRPGTWTIELMARSEGPQNALKRPAPGGPWREGDEIWAFQARPELRIAEVEGVSAIDAEQTTLPADWKKLPTYPMGATSVMTLTERRRGFADPPPDQLSLRRTFWVDFNGGGVSVRDVLSGALSRSQRLEMVTPTSLGHVTVNGRDLFITHLENPNENGVELRPGPLNVTADSRIEGSVGELPAVGWNHDIHNLTASLHLPPGYRLFHASGVDEVQGTWIKHFTLLEIFLVLVIALGVGRLWGIRWGVVALLATTLLFPEANAPKMIWIAVLVAEALVRVVPKGNRIESLLRVTRLGVTIGLVIISVPFLITHVRHGIYPGLGAIESHTEVIDALDGARREDFGAATNAPPPPSTVIAGGAGGIGQANLDNIADEDREKGGEVAEKPAPQAARKVAAPKDMKGSLGFSTVQSPSQTNSRGNFTTEYDPKAIVQTGKGLPVWNETTLALTWSGPVEKSQTFRLYLLGPTGNLFLALLRALFLVALIARVAPFTEKTWTILRKRPSGTAAAVAILLAFALPLFHEGTARADIPSTEVLTTLEERLLAKPSCFPTCAASPELGLDIRSGEMRGRFLVDATFKTAVPLPGSLSQWRPRSVLVDGKNVGMATINGNLVVIVEAGSHDVVFEGPLPDRESLQIALPLKSKHVRAEANGWTIEGIHEDGVADDNLQLTRVRKATNEKSGSDDSLPPYVEVKRTLRVGLEWQVETQVTRISAQGTAVVLEIPLLRGESVTTAGVRVVAGKALVNMSPSESTVGWASNLEIGKSIDLAAPAGLPWREVWVLDASPIFHTETRGIPPVRPVQPNALPEWRPWPKETLNISITKPEGAAGQSLTIDSSRFDIRPGLRTTESTLTLSLRSSRGSEHPITLPEGATVEKLTVGNVPQQWRQEGRNVILSVVPGASRIQLTWREANGIQTMFSPSKVDLGIPSVNVTTHVELSNARWTLFLRGPTMGPAVLFWSLFLVLIVLAFGLAKLGTTPLGFGSWLLLLIGVSQADILAAGVVAGWLLVLSYRGKAADVRSIHWFNIRQMLLVAWTIAAAGVLLSALHQGLLGTPDMQIQGNSSSATELFWFQDRADRVPDQPWVLSLSVFAYRALMLLWSLWLALSLLKWVKWGWAAFGNGGFWRSTPRMVRTPEPAPQAATTTLVEVAQPVEAPTSEEPPQV